MKLKVIGILAIILLSLVIAIPASASQYYLSAYAANEKALLNFNSTTLTIDDTGKTAWTSSGVTRNTTTPIFGASSAFFGSTITSNTFNGNGSSALALGTGNFTILLWINITTNSSQQQIYEGRPSGSNGNYPVIELANSPIKLSYLVNNAYVISGTNPTTNTPHQIIVQRNTSTGLTSMYLDGVLNGTPWTDTTNYLCSGNAPGLGSYTNSGSYSISGSLDSVTVWNTVVPVSQLWPQKYEVGGLIPDYLTASFTQNVTAGYNSYQAVQFNDTSFGSPTTWNWTYTGIGSNTTPTIFSTLQNPVATFWVGNFSISLNVTNSTGAFSTSSPGAWINVSAPTPIVASFVATNTNGVSPLRVSFADTSTGTPTAWSWTYTGTGTNTTPTVFSTSQNPTALFYAGNFRITLNASNAYVSNITPSSTWVNVSSSFIPLNYTYSQSHNITGSSSWPGDQSNYQIPIDVYSGPGSSSGSAVYLNNHAYAFPYDIAFTLSDGTTQIPMWLDYNNVNATHARYWVSLPTVSKSSTTQIYAYYGDPSYKKQSDGSLTFPFYDQEGDLFGNIMNSGTNYPVAGIQLANGSILAAWANQVGGGDCTNNAYIQAALSPDGVTWGTPWTIQSEAPNRRDTEVQFMYNAGDLYMIYSSVLEKDAQCDSPRPSILYIKKSLDGTPTNWSSAVQISSYADVFTDTSPAIQLTSGRWIIPTQYQDLNNVTHEWSSVMYSDNFNTSGLSATWIKGGNITDPNLSPAEAAMQQTSDGQITSIMRNDYIGYNFLQSRSADGGITWSAPVTSSIPSTQARAELVKNYNGDIILAWADTSHSATGAAGTRTPLGAAILNDTATGIVYKKDLNTASYEFHNMGIFPKTNGDLVIVTAYGTVTGDESYVFQEPLLKTGLKNNLYTQVGSPSLTTTSGYLDFTQTGANQYLYGANFGNGSELQICNKRIGTYKSGIGFGGYDYPRYTPFTSIYPLVLNGAGTYSANGGSSYSASSTVSDDTNFHTDQLQWQYNNVTFIRDGSIVGTPVTTNIPNTLLPVEIGQPYYGGNNQESGIDNLFARNFISPEPVQGAWGPEQNYGASTLLSKFIQNQTVGYGYPATVQFTDTSTGSPNSWNWTFGDGRTSTQQNPNYSYMVADLYPVALNVTNSSGSYSVSSGSFNLTTDLDIYVKSWMHFENDTVIDLMGNAWTTNAGATTSTAQHRYGNRSLSIPGGRSYITSASSPIWNIGNLDFEKDFWIYPVSMTTAQNIISRTTGLGTGTTSGWGFYNGGSPSSYSFWMGSLANATPTFALANNAWQQIKIERTNGRLEVYVNGTLVVANNQPGSFDTANPVTIGVNLGGTTDSFFIDENRFSTGTSREVGNFSTPWTQYNGNLFQNYININTNATLLYKSYPGNASVANLTPHYRTMQVENLTNASSITAGITFDPLHESAISILPNATSYADLQITNQSIDNADGIVSFTVSRTSGLGMQSLFNNRTSLVDVPFNYNNYTTDQQFQTFFTNASVTDSQHGVTYPITTFLQNYVNYLPWTIYSGFNASATNVSVGQSIQFTDQSLGEPAGFTNWSWNFGDSGTSTSQNPMYAYSTPGIYTVSMISSLFANSSITNSTTKTGYITVTNAPLPAPVAKFNGTPTIITAGSAVQFVDMSSNSPTSWSWNFGDSTGSSLQNPLHVYSTVGNYSVSLNATNAQGSDTATISNYITVIAVAPPVASFTTNISSGQSPLVVQFTDTSSNLPTSWSWNIKYSNGTNYYNSALQNPVVTFNDVATYVVNETVYNAAGSSLSVQNVTVINPTGFTRQDLVMSPFYTLKVTFVDSSTNQPIPIVTVTDSDGNNQTTANGIFTQSYPFSTVVIYASSSGYTSASMSYVVDSDRTETMQMVKAPTTPTVVGGQIANPIYVSLHFTSGFGTPLPGVIVTATPYNTTTGSFAYIQSLISIPLSAAPMNNQTMTGISGTDGKSAFYIIPTTSYNFTYSLANYTFSPPYLYTSFANAQDVYITGSQGAQNSEFLTYGTDINSNIFYTVATAQVNKSYTWVNVTYLDKTGTTTSGTLTITEPNLTPYQPAVSVATFPVNASSQSWSVLLDPAFSSSASADLSATTTAYGTINETKSVELIGAPIPFMGFGEDIELLFCLFVMMGTVMLGAAPSARQVVVGGLAFEMWVFYFIGWFQGLTDRGVPSAALLLGMTLVTIMAIVGVFEHRKKKEKY